MVLLCVTIPVPARAQGLFAVSSVGLGEELTFIGMSHRDPNFVMVGTAVGKIYRTTDAGSTWQEILITPARTLFWGRQRNFDPTMEYAPGLPGKSPHLQRMLREQGLTTSGINLQQLLVTKGDKMVAINWIEVDWHDENRIFVASMDGLYRSLDKGRTFHRVFQGYVSPAERMVNTVATDPFDSRNVLIGTASGLFLSTNGGTVFTKTMDYYMRDSYIREIWYSPHQQGLVHVAMGGSAMASPDGGKNWITTHWDEWGPRADVQSISLGPQNLCIIGTQDGLYASWQGCEMGTWQRRGLRFVGHTLTKVMITSDPNLWLALNDEAIWFSADAGVSWAKVFQTGGKEVPRWITSFGGDVRHLWFITNRQIYRVGLPPLSRGTFRPGRRNPEIPPLHDLLRRVLRYNRLYFADNQRYRNRGPWSVLLPDIMVTYGYAPRIITASHFDRLYERLSYRYFPVIYEQTHRMEVFAWWDLGRLIFDRREMPFFGRINENLYELRQEITERVHRLYREYVQASRTLAQNPPAVELVRQNLQLRLQEITAYLNAMSGGYFVKEIGGEP